MEHALRHGCFAFANTSYREARHRQILYVDELGHGFQRQALQRLVCNKSNDAEVLLLVQLCRETVTKVGDVLSEVVATGVIDLLEYLNAGRDEVDHELRLWPPGHKATKGDPDAVVSVGLQAVAALRALVKSKEPKPAHATSAVEEVPKFERVKSNFSRSDSSMASAAAAAAGSKTGLGMIVGEDFDTYGYRQHMVNLGVNLNGVEVRLGKKSGYSYNISNKQGRGMCLSYLGIAKNQSDWKPPYNEISKSRAVVISEKFSPYTLQTIVHAKSLGKLTVINGMLKTANKKMGR